LGSTPATQRYKACPEATIAHGAIGSKEGRVAQAVEARLRQGRLVSGLDVNLPVY